MSSKDDLNNIRNIASDMKSSLGQNKQAHSSIPSVDGSDSILTESEQEFLQVFEYTQEFHLPILALDSLRKIGKGGYSKEHGIQFVQTLQTDEQKAAEEAHLQELDEELEDLLHQENRKNSMIDNLLSTIAIKTAVYDTNPNKREKALLPLISERDALEREILKLQKENDALEQELDKQQLNALKTHSDTKKALDNLVNAKNEQKDIYSKLPEKETKQYEKILKEIATTKRKAVILSEIIPVCFFFSRLLCYTNSPFIDADFGKWY